jgi:hypothetical protein
MLPTPSGHVEGSSGKLDSWLLATRPGGPTPSPCVAAASLLAPAVGLLDRKCHDGDRNVTRRPLGGRTYLLNVAGATVARFAMDRHD